MSDTTPETPTAGQNDDQIISTTADRFRQFVIERDALASKLVQAQRTIESVQAEYQAVVLKDGEDIKRLERELTDMEKGKHVIQHERDEYYAELEQTEQQLAQAQGEASTAKANLAHADEKISELQEYIKSCAGMIPDGQTGVLAGRIENLKAELTAAREECERLRENEQPLVREFVKTTKERDQLRAEKAELLATITEANGCFIAAEVEGLDNAIAERNSEQLVGLLERRILCARVALAKHQPEQS